MLPAAGVFCFGGSSVARPGGRDDASIVPYKSFAMFAAIGQGFSAAG